MASFDRRRLARSDGALATLSLCVLVSCVLCTFPSAATAFVPSTTKSQTNNNLGQAPIFSPVILSAEKDQDGDPVIGNKVPMTLRPDTSMSFGSEADGAAAEEDDEDYYETQENEYQARREAVIQKALEEQDKKDREERRREVWGEFADAETPEEVEAIKKKLKEKFDRENEFKAQVAKQQGVELEVLEVKDNDGSFFDIDGPSRDKLGRTYDAPWYQGMDNDLKEEWAALGDGKTEIEMEDGSLTVDEEEEEEEPDDLSSITDDTVAVDGKIVSKDVLKGVRIGSAGGWTLEIFPGDFVVHRKYGIGKFERSTTTPRLKLTGEELKARDARRKEILTQKIRENKGSVPQDVIREIQATFGTEEDLDPISNPQVTVLEISYSDGIVQVPVDRAYRLSRYRAADAAVKPRLSKIRGDQWRNARKKVEASTLEMAQDVLALYATRETLQRQPFDPDHESEVKEFEKTFKFEPTKDQEKCFEDVENDMVYRARPMDRLICGDVGFGKTEVAIRALFRCVKNGRQAAMLAPTGVLASQHYKNILMRVGEDSGYNLKVCLLRGGMGPKSRVGRELRNEIENGDYDIIIGTHALLSKSITFKDLGLLVVDEEQRFGVKQKERLKLICEGIDVLTLSATPIPRTLQMSISGIRDTSTIRSPPSMRKATKTHVEQMGPEIVKEAIGKELARKGQCFYVVPQIKMLDEAEELIRECFPDISIITAHGRMGRNQAEMNVGKFAEGGIDVLLATTVIENGVDIPSVNTIIIQNSENFGMSTLYQLRGRVGRSDLQGYAYFLHEESRMTESSIQRLGAIGDLNELGSGFDVANRDLEIRGAGSLLGTEQSGAAQRVGFDLYMRMLKKSIRQLRGLDLPLMPRTNIILPRRQGSLFVNKKDESGKMTTVHSFRIPESYITDKSDRDVAEAAVRLAESSTTLVELTNKWKDEYGPLPATLQTKLKTMHLHACTRRLGIDVIGLVENEEGEADCVMRSTGLRPRHWGKILSLLPKGRSPKGLDVVFPARFTLSGDEEEISGGKRIDIKSLLEDSSLNDDSEDWDALDEEEVEAMKDIASAYTIKKMDEIDFEIHPRLVIKNFGTGKQAVDRLLKVLLPVARTVYQQQEKEKENAKNAAEIRKKRMLIEEEQKKASSRMAGIYSTNTGATPFTAN